MPAGVLALGLLLGGLSALTSMGMVLIYRAQRFINLAQASIGLACGAVVAQLMARAGWSFFVAAPAGVLLGPVLGVGCAGMLGGRIGRAPRIVLTAASAGLAWALGAARIALTGWFGSPPFLRIPLRVEVDIFPVRFTAGHLISAAAVPVCSVALGIFLSRSRAGLATRAAAQNSERARSLGVSAERMTMLAWAIAGALSAIAGIMLVALQGPSLQGGLGTTALLLALAPAVLARMRSLPVALAGSLLIGMAYQAGLWITGRAALSTLVLLGVIAAASLLRRPRERREEEAMGASAWSAYAAVRPLPHAVASHPAVRAGSRGLFVLAAAAALAAPWLVSPSAAQRFGVVAVFAIAAVAAAIPMAFAGRLSMGHWALVGIGATTAVMLGARFGTPAAVLAAVAFSGVASVLLGLVSSRAGALGYAAVTLAFAIAFRGAITLVPALRSQRPVVPASIGSLAATSDAAVASLAVAALVLVLLAVRALRSSSLGRSMVAARDNETVAAVNGVATTRVALIAYAASGAVAGLAGYLYAISQRVVHPDAFVPERSLVLLGMVVVGGLGSPWGAVLGASAIGAASLYLRDFWSFLGTGAAMLEMLVVMPAGLAGVVRGARDRLAMRIAPPTSVTVSSSHGSGPNRLDQFGGASPPQAPPKASAVLHVEDLRVRFGVTDALAGVSLDLRAGEILALVGTNGAGKTTLLRACSGLVAPLSGLVRFDGRDVRGESPEALSRLGLTFVDGSRPIFADLTVIENLAMAASSRRRADQVLERFPALAGRGRSLAGTLSGGQQRLLAIAQTSFARSRVLLVDELSLGLDDTSLAELHGAIRLLASEGTAVIAVEHRLASCVDLADRVIFLDQGVVRFSGSPGDLVRREELMRPVLLNVALAGRLR